MILWIILLVPMVQVTSITTPIVNDLSSMTKFISQVRARVYSSESIKPSQFEKMSQLITRLSCRIHEASKKLQAMGALADQDKTLYHELVEALNLDNYSPIWPITYNAERIKQLHEQFLDRWSRSDVDALRLSIPEIVESRSEYVPALLQETYRLIAPSSHADNGYSRLIEKKNTLTKEFCNLSLGLAIYRLHANVVYAELLGFVMGLYAYTLKSVYRQKSYETEINRLELGTKTRLKEYLSALQDPIKKAPTLLVNCEHKGHHTRGSTYVDFDGFIQGYLVIEEDIAETDTCYYGCAEVPKKTRLNRRTDIYNKGVYDRPCTGLIYDCEYFGYNVDVCYGDENLGRRYDHLKNATATYGQESCNAASVTVENWHHKTLRCEHCFCTCVDNGRGSKATRAISYRWVQSNYPSHKVVTGIRILVKDGLIRFEIQEGQLLPGGGINKDGQQWAQMENFEYRDEGEHGAYYIGSQPLNPTSDFDFLQNDMVEFEVATTPIAEGAIIGVRFTKSPNGRIGLAVVAFPVDWSAGKLDISKPAKSYYFDSNNIRDEFVLHDPGRPINFVGNKLVGQNKWIRLQPSSRQKDAAQSTVPFFDAREVVADFPIKRIGIAYRGAEDGHTGGFFVPTIETFNPAEIIKLEE